MIEIIIFKTLLSHRYGSRSLPTRIIADEFEILKNEVINQKSIQLNFSAVIKEKTIKMDNILESCYELDENEIPARYRLAFLSKLFPNINIRVI